MKLEKFVKNNDLKDFLDFRNKIEEDMLKFFLVTGGRIINQEFGTYHEIKFLERK